MREMWKKISKMVIFVILLLGLLIMLGKVVQPMWKNWNNYNTTFGFYNEPKNSIQAVFVGTSVVINSVTSMEIYENYGISTYNLATEQQPVVSSLAWVKEAYRMHPNSLKTVIFDVSALRNGIVDSYFRKSIDGMQITKNKYDAIYSYTGSFIDSMDYLFPVFAYHSRWDSLDKSDFEKYYDEPKSYLRGYNFITDQDLFIKNDYDKVTAPAYYVHEDSEPSTLNEGEVNSFLEMVEFCDKKGIDLVLIKLPVIDSWSSANHNAIIQMLEENGLEDMELLDMNYQPLLGEIGYDHYVDSVDSRHVNYWGATKITKWLGKYLTENFSYEDISETKHKNWLEQELQNYRSSVLSAELQKIVDPAEYIEYVSNLRKYIVTISVCGEAADALTQEQRDTFAELRLVNLSELENGDAYIGILNGNSILCDQRCDMVDPDMQAVRYEDIMEAGHTKISLFSGKKENRNISSCCINGNEYSSNAQGLNIVVYDPETKEVVDKASFDTHNYSERESKNWQEDLDYALENNIPMEEWSEEITKLYLYHQKCQDKNDIEILTGGISNKDFLKYIKQFSGNEDYTLIMCAQDEAAKYLDDVLREQINSLGLDELSKLEYRESYIAVLQGNNIYEDRGDVNTQCTYDDDMFHVISAGYLCGNMSSCVIEGEEYSKAQTGINVIVYNNVTQKVIDYRNFNTHSYIMNALK